MAKLFASLIAFALASRAHAHGEQAKPVPKLSPETLAAIGATAGTAPAAGPTSQTAATCFEGFTLYSDGSCVKEINEPAIPRTGEVTVPYLTQCPPNYTPQGPGQCAYTSYTEPNYFCPVGFADDGAFCTGGAEAVLPVSMCDAGELVGNQCINRVTAPYIVTPECPDGSTVEEDGGCWKVIETFDCTPQAHTGKNGRAVTAGRSGSGLAAGTHVRVEKSQSPLLRATIHEQPAPIPRSTAPLAPLSTSPIGLPRPTVAHPGHYQLLAQDSKGRRAIHRALAGKKYLPPVGKDAPCTAPVVAPVIVGPANPGAQIVNPVPGFPVAVPTEPLLTTVAPAPGFPNAAILEQGVEAADECTKDLVSVTAPHAYKVGIATQSCAKKTQVDAIALVSCPEDFYDDGTACVREFAAEPTLTCLGGLPAVNGVCTGPISRVPKIQKCTDGTSPVGGKCLLVDLIPGKKTCGPGFTDVGTGCSGVVSTGGPAFECPDNLTLVGDRCIGQSVRPAVAITMTSEATSCSK